MPDCSAAEIIIGGTIATPAALAQLLAALNPYCCDWDEEPEDGWLAEIKARAFNGEPIVVREQEQPGGEFRELVSLCHDLGLHYHQADDGHYAYGPANTRFNPDEDREVAYPLSGNIEQGGAVPLDKLRAWVEDGLLAERTAELLRLRAPVPAIRLAPGVCPEVGA